MRIKEIREYTGLSQVKFCQRYGIPRRTLEDWESGRNQAADYLMELLWRAVQEDFKKEGLVSNDQAKKEERK